VGSVQALDRSGDTLLRCLVAMLHRRSLREAVE
jgi:hypothetical protein